MSRSGKKKNRGPYFSGGSGSSIEDAIIINSDDPFEGISLESVYISQFYELKGEKWEILMQGLVIRDERYFDVITVREESGRERQFYFDITAFYGNY